LDSIPIPIVAHSSALAPSPHPQFCSQQSHVRAQHRCAPCPQDVSQPHIRVNTSRQRRHPAGVFAIRSAVARLHQRPRNAQVERREKQPVMVRRQKVAEGSQPYPHPQPFLETPAAGCNPSQPSTIDFRPSLTPIPATNSATATEPYPFRITSLHYFATHLI
jgi:hypothetical protein